MIVDYKILDRIDKKKAAIDNNPDYYLLLYKNMKNKLKRYSNIHSYWMENPDLRNRILIKSDKKSSKELKRAHKDISSMFKAWDFLHGQVEESDGLSFINSRNILIVGNYIEPRINLGFRNVRASVRSKYVIPNCIKIPDLIDNFCSNMRESEMHPIELGINCHLHISMIHPFFDGNGRAARIFQDTILYANGYPPSIITFSERNNYINYLEEAALGVQEIDLVKQRGFFNYIAGKIDNTLDKIVESAGSKKVA